KEIESGKGNPSLKTLEKIAHVLGMELRLEIRRSE
ncbi:MAG: helix-turn-helix domain-containing protein, partial [Sinomicrobium sp.]|nr:helix-turn-helix domain-containing protein [Sinomicrobium sp.]